jgi:uncharacterized protein (TIGR02265 family)
VRGVILQGIVDEADRAGKSLPNSKKYIPFKEYPSSEGHQLFFVFAQKMYPGLPIREGLRRAGRTIYPALLGSMIGKVLFGAIGGKIETLMRFVPKGYSVSTNEAKANLKEISEARALFYIESFPNFDLSYHIGILEGIANFCQKRCECLVRRASPKQSEIVCTWS